LWECKCNEKKMVKKYCWVLIQAVRQSCCSWSCCRVLELGFQLYILVYTGCPRRNVPDFGMVFLMLKYTDITHNTYVQS